MPAQNVWDNLLFDLASSLTLGFVTDLKTALLAAVFLGFLAMGFDMLVELLHSMSATSLYSKAGKYLGLMRSDEELYGKDSAEYDYHSRIYEQYMSGSVKQTFAGGKPAFQPDVIMTDGDVASRSNAVYEDLQGAHARIDQDLRDSSSSLLPDPDWGDNHRAFHDSSDED